MSGSPDPTDVGIAAADLDAFVPGSGFALDIDNTLADVESFFLSLRITNPSWRHQASPMTWLARASIGNTDVRLRPMRDAVTGVAELSQRVPLVAYITARPEADTQMLEHWLKEMGFPDLPVIGRPSSATGVDHGEWKATLLHRLYPLATGIVDDNLQLPSRLGPNYPGTVVVLNKSAVRNDFRSIPARSWSDLVTLIPEILKRTLQQEPAMASLRPGLE